jgi:serine/threonine-protein kinase RIO1
MGTEVKDGDSENTPTSAPVWAQREFQNLQRLEKAGVPCPHPQFVKKSVMVMEFVGQDGKAAWKLRDYPFINDTAVKQAYEQVIHVSYFVQTLQQYFADHPTYF